ncbi:MAG: GNAT family N-acetyltransferase [Alphaproteobacteria bacterium]
MLNYLSLKSQLKQDLYLQSILKLAVGFPTDEKMTQVIDSYVHASNKYIIGIKFNSEIVGLTGITLVKQDAIINHIAVVPKYQMQGFGKKLVNHIIERYKLKSIIA